jgi:hypothetical protein
MEVNPGQYALTYGSTFIYIHTLSQRYVPHNVFWVMNKDVKENGQHISYFDLLGGIRKTKGTP